MGIDGAEIKRLRLKREKEALATQAVEQRQPEPAEENTEECQATPTADTSGKPSISKARDIIGKSAAAILLILVAVAFIDNTINTPKQPTKRSYSPPSTSSSASSSYAPSTNYADIVVAVLNTTYGNVCHAEITGWFSKTLKIDWTGQTNKFAMLKVMAEVGSVKEKLYSDGVRYFQFPNDSGTYNVIDWETGQKTSTSDRAMYYFPN